MIGLSARGGRPMAVQLPGPASRTCGRTSKLSHWPGAGPFALSDLRVASCYFRGRVDSTSGESSVEIGFAFA
jgi:hypothetical protein